MLMGFSQSEENMMEILEATSLSDLDPRHGLTCFRLRSKTPKVSLRLMGCYAFGM